MKDYDIRSAFEEIEIELIESMKRNLDRHKKWETDEGINWSMWQAEQLKTLEEFKRKNKKIFNKRFSVINQAVKEVLKDTYKTSGFQQEREILEAIVKNKSLTDNVTKGLEGAFFSLDEDKMNALINATIKDMSKAEHAVLRMANDQYRKTIFKAQVMSNSGAFTLQQSIDAATRDFLKAGINCVQYKNGRRVNIASYSEMCLRTSTKRAKLVAEGEARNASGIHTVKISKYGQCSETCLPWQGKVYVDDVWSGGTNEEATEKKLPLLSEAIKGGLFHPNCKHVSYTYFYDFKKSLGKLQEDGIENPPAEQEHHKNQLHIQQQKRLEKGSLDPQNIKEAKIKKEQWIEKDELLLENHPELNYSDGLDIMKLNKEAQRKSNSDELVNHYLNKINAKTDDKEVIKIVKESMKLMPENDLKILDEFSLDLNITNKNSRYHRPKLLGKLIGDKRTIYLNPKNYQKGMFAHEFAHYAADVNNLYEDKTFLGLLKSVVNNLDGYKIKTINKKDYVYAISKCFVNDYQGRTYIEKENFKGVLKPHQLREYISVGYQTYVVNPQFLEARDKPLYNYFERRGLTK